MGSFGWMKNMANGAKKTWRTSAHSSRSGRRSLCGSVTLPNPAHNDHSSIISEIKDIAFNHLILLSLYFNKLSSIEVLAQVRMPCMQSLGLGMRLAMQAIMSSTKPEIWGRRTGPNSKSSTWVTIRRLRRDPGAWVTWLRTVPEQDQHPQEGHWPGGVDELGSQVRIEADGESYQYFFFE